MRRSIVGALACVLCLSGCAVTGTNKRVRCASLADRGALAGAFAKGGAALAGASGLATVATDDRAARLSLALGAVVAGALAAAADVLHDDATERRVTECAK